MLNTMPNPEQPSAEHGMLCFELSRGVGQRNYHFFFGFVTSAIALEWCSTWLPGSPIVGVLGKVLCLAMMVLPVLFPCLQLVH